MRKILFYTSLFFLSGCTLLGPSPTTSGSMSCTLNGDPWNAVEFNNTILHETEEIPTGKRLDIRGTDDDGLMIILSMAITSSATGNDMPLATYTTATYTFEALITLMQGTSLVSMSTGTNGGDDGTITLTSIDPGEMTCSGTFQFEAYNFSTDEISHTGVSGVFEDMIYTVL